LGGSDSPLHFRHCRVDFYVFVEILGLFDYLA
jgi:hypothetical protein